MGVTDEPSSLTAVFTAERDRLLALAHRMVGSRHDAEDVVQQVWIRAAGHDLQAIENLPGWLTTVTARRCLDVLRARSRQATGDLADDTPAVGHGPHAGPAPGAPDQAAERSEDIGLALLVVLDRLSPAQRVAFVLHDLFSLPFAEIAPVVDRSVPATKKLASRARARVAGAAPASTGGEEHRQIVQAFLAAARTGDLGRLVALLDPDVVRRADPALVPDGPTVLRGARAVAEETGGNAARAAVTDVALVDGEEAFVVAPGGRLVAVLRFAVRRGRIAEIDVVADPHRLAATTIHIVDRVG